jgi:dipeptidyl aminopeptidase/acylaminoacyl peptidase
LDLTSWIERELTSAEKSERSPQWSPDGKWLGFLSNRGGRTQVWLAPAGGGEAHVLTDRRWGVEAFRWSPDGRRIAYLARDDDASPSDDGPQVADRISDLARLWVADLDGGARRLGPAGWRIDDLQWRDNDQLLVAASERPSQDAYNDAVFGLSTVDGRAPTRVATPPQPFDTLLTSPDGASFAVRGTLAEGPSPRDLLVTPMAGGTLKDISAPIGLAAEEARWLPDGALWARVADGFHGRIYRLPPAGAPERIPLTLSVAAFDVSARGEIAFVGEDYAHRPEIYLRTPDGRVRQVSHLQVNETPLSPVEIFKVKSFDGTPIEAALMKPTPAASQPPLVLIVHGGPGSSFSAGYGWEVAWGQMLAAHGYAVLMVNPRGSDGYSEAFLKANRGDWGGGDFRDLMAAVDAVIARGDADPDRLGIGGWSYGGEMTALAIGRTRRFKAAVDGAGVYDQQAEFETEREPQADEWYLGTPWAQPEVFARNSPASFIGAARTPTLILGGTDDASNPVGQSKGLYRALKHLGVETQMVLYPGEGHSPRRGAYNVDMFQRILEWYDRHLMGAPGSSQDAPPPGGEVARRAGP